jgi:hypothetical protein
MELSPRAQERLARIGGMSDAEKQRLQHEAEIESALAPYFTGSASTEELWQCVRSLMAAGGPDVVKQAQSRIAGTFRMQMSKDDFESRKKALLALETLKPSGKYSALELLLGSVTSLKQRYEDVKTQALEQVREQMQDQVRAAADQARRQGVLVDTASTMEATLKASPEWRDFASRHDAAAQKTLDDYLARIRAML